MCWDRVIEIETARPLASRRHTGRHVAEPSAAPQHVTDETLEDSALLTAQANPQDFEHAKQDTLSVVSS